MTVHIVEDDYGVRDALSELCRAVGRTVRVYPDGEAFASGANVEPEDTVLVDIGLPGEPGTEVVRRLFRLPLPPTVIVISGLPLADIHHAMRDFSDVIVMRKPLTSELLGLLA